jgi:DNA-binding transcriptional regulator YdaS (Cro superfamily)
MNLDAYLSQPGAPSMAALARDLGLHPDQVRQWRHGHDKRQPRPENCTAIERVTDRAVMRWDLRPDDWHRIWPELIGQAGAPSMPASEAA